MGGSAWILGRRVDVSGRVRRELRVTAVRVRIEGTVEGDVYLAARDIEILPAARITGSLSYWSGQEARIAPEARIAGRVIQHQPRFFDRDGRVLTVLGLVTRALVVVNLFVSGVVLFLLFPRFTVAAARTVERRPWTSLGIGVAVLVLTPLAAVFLALTVIAIPLALALAALYVLALLLGFITAAFALGDLGARAFRRGAASRPRRTHRPAGPGGAGARSRPLRAGGGAADPAHRARAGRRRLDATALPRLSRNSR